MHDRKLVVAVLGALGFIVILPFVINAFGTASSPVGEKAYEADLRALKADKGGCVRETREEMRENHMQILNGWRNDVVRGGGFKMEKPIGGVTYQKSLTLTCLGCHSKTSFCTKCHDYSGVRHDCWDCHVDPEEK